jgi:starch synthase
LGLQQIPLSIGASDYAFSVQTASFAGTDIPMYFIDCPALFDRPALYTFDPDEHKRFLLFTRAVLESCRRSGLAPHIFHCNDWHTAFLPLYLKTLYAADTWFAKCKTVLTIHNAGFQGVMPSSAVADLNLGLAWTQLDQADLTRGVVNPLKTGVKHADRVTTVSPTYAREICEATLGMGLESTLRERTDRVIGILNGVDYAEWDPRYDRHLSAHFSAEDLRGKAVNKDLLISAVRLGQTLSVPLIGMVTRLTAQKGIDLLFDALRNWRGASRAGLPIASATMSRWRISSRRAATFFSCLPGTSPAG